MKIDEHFFDGLDDDLRIKKTDLANEWVKQPNLFSKYATASAELKRIAQEKAEQAKLIKSELKADATENPDACLGRGVKPSNEKIEAYATAHQDYQNAVQKAIEAQYRADMAENAVFALHQRKAALENLVRLASMEYFATPNESGDLGDFGRDARHQETVDRIRARNQNSDRETKRRRS